MASADALDVDLRRHALADLRHVGHRHLGLHFELRQVDDRQQRRIESDLFARLHVALGDDAGDRRTHDRVVHLDLRLFELGARRRDRRQLRLIGRVGGVERVLRDEVLLDQLGIGLARALGRCELRAGRLQCRGPLGELGAQLRGIELGNDLADGDAVAFAHQDALDLGRQLGAHRGLRHRQHAAGHRQFDRQPLGLQLHDVGLRELQRRPLILLGGIRRRTGTCATR